MYPAPFKGGGIIRKHRTDSSLGHRGISIYSTVQIFALDPAVTHVLKHTQMFMEVSFAPSQRNFAIVLDCSYYRMFIVEVSPAVVYFKSLYTKDSLLKCTFQPVETQMKFIRVCTIC